MDMFLGLLNDHDKYLNLLPRLAWVSPHSPLNSEVIADNTQKCTVQSSMKDAGQVTSETAIGRYT